MDVHEQGNRIGGEAKLRPETGCDAFFKDLLLFFDCSLRLQHCHLTNLEIFPKIRQSNKILSTYILRKARGKVLLEMCVNFNVDTHAQDGVPVYGFCKNSAGVQMASCYKERSLSSLITV